MKSTIKKLFHLFIKIFRYKKMYIDEKIIVLTFSKSDVIKNFFVKKNNAKIIIFTDIIIYENEKLRSFNIKKIDK